MTTHEAWTLYETYVSGWKATSPEQRAAIIKSVVAPDVHYTTPRHASGDVQLVIEDAATFQAKFPGGHFDIGDVSAHHDVALLTWVLVRADGTEFARGHDQIHVTNGKIDQLTTFAPSALEP